MTSRIAILSEPQAAPAEPRPVLLAEDDPVARMVTKRLLERAGYEVTAVADGAAAVQALRARYYAVLLTDWDMPVLDGLGVISAVRGGDWPGYVYTILLTGHDSRDALLRGLAAGADDYVTKPVDGAELLARMTTGWRISDLEQRLRKAHEEAVKLSLSDALTGLSNRRHLSAVLLAEIARGRRFNHPLSVVICDIDRFKLINDVHGHYAGDAVLKAFATILGSNLRSHIDTLARFGGDEFVLVLPESAQAATQAVAEKLRQAVDALEVDHEGRVLEITASFGAAVLAPDSASVTPDALIAQADLCLYEAKQAGRNRVCVKILP
jgi:two-component system, cell cycle response regulator